MNQTDEYWLTHPPWKKEDCVNFYKIYEMSNMGIRESPNCLKKNFNCLNCEDYEKDK